MTTTAEFLFVDNSVNKGSGSGPENLNECPLCQDGICLRHRAEILPVEKFYDDARGRIEAIADNPKVEAALEELKEGHGPTYRHSLRVAMQLDDFLSRNGHEEARRDALIAGSLHDIYKQRDNDIKRLIDEPRTLTSGEREIVGAHAHGGADVILSEVGEDTAAFIAYYHHSAKELADIYPEYPAQLTLLTVIADSIDGMTDVERSYRKDRQKYDPLDNVPAIYDTIIKNLPSQCREEGVFGVPVRDIVEQFFAAETTMQRKLAGAGFAR